MGGVGDRLASLASEALDRFARGELSVEVLERVLDGLAEEAAMHGEAYAAGWIAGVLSTIEWLRALTLDELRRVVDRLALQA